MAALLHSAASFSPHNLWPEAPVKGAHAGRSATNLKMLAMCSLWAPVRDHCCLALMVPRTTFTQCSVTSLSGWAQLYVTEPLTSQGQPAALLAGSMVPHPN